MEHWLLATVVDHSHHHEHTMSIIITIITIIIIIINIIIITNIIADIQLVLVVMSCSHSFLDKRE